MVDVRDIQIVLLSGGAVRLLRQYRSDWIVERAKSVAELIVETCGDRSLEVANLLASDAITILTSLQGYAVSAIEQANMMLSLVDGVVEDDVESEKPGDSPEESEQKSNAKSRRRPKARKVSVTEEVSVSQLGLDEAIVDKMLDVGIGTTLQALEYDENTGLSVILGDETALAVLATIEEHSAAKSS